MDIELQEIRDFVSQHVLFDDLPDVMLDILVNTLTIRYLRRGQVFPPEDITEHYLYLCRTGAISLRDEEGNLIEKLAENDSCIEQCLNEEKFELQGRVTDYVLSQKILTSNFPVQ